MKDLKTKIIFIVFALSIIIQRFTKNSSYDDYIAYAQTGILIVLILLLIKRFINDFKDKSKPSKEKYAMIINMIIIIILLVIGYFIINSTMQNP